MCPTGSEVLLDPAKSQMTERRDVARDPRRKKPFRSSARRTSRGTGQRVLRARRARTRPMWPSERTGRGGARTGKGARTATCGTARCSCSPSCAPSSTSYADSGTRSLSDVP